MKDRSDADDSRTRAASQTRIHNRKESYTNMGIKMDARQYIRIRGANENNLKNIDVDIPRNELVVLTGLSGSGKSSLAFDTIYAEGQRRYMGSSSR